MTTNVLLDTYTHGMFIGGSPSTANNTVKDFVLRKPLPVITTEVPPEEGPSFGSIERTSIKSSRREDYY